MAIYKLEEDTVQKSNGKWTNRGKDGTEHGEFDTKEQADKQRKAMFANGYSEDLDLGLIGEVVGEGSPEEEVVEIEEVEPTEPSFTTEQVEVLDELSYLISTEYEAVKWYDESVGMIKRSGLSSDLIDSTIEGINQIRKDEEDHIHHLERLVDQIKTGILNPYANVGE